MFQIFPIQLADSLYYTSTYTSNVIYLQLVIFLSSVSGGADSNANTQIPSVQNPKSFKTINSIQNVEYIGDLTNDAGLNMQRISARKQFHPLSSTSDLSLFDRNSSDLSQLDGNQSYKKEFNHVFSKSLTTADLEPDDETECFIEYKPLVYIFFV